MKTQKRMLLEVMGLYAHIEKLDMRFIYSHTKVNEETRTFFAMTLEGVYDIALHKPDTLVTLEDYAQAVAKAKRVPILAEKMAKFGDNQYHIFLFKDEPNEKELRRVADCFICMEKIPRREKELRRKIRQAKTFDEMSHLIVYGL